MVYVEDEIALSWAENLPFGINKSRYETIILPMSFLYVFGIQDTRFYPLGYENIHWDTGHVRRKTGLEFRRRIQKTLHLNAFLDILIRQITFTTERVLCESDASLFISWGRSTLRHKWAFISHPAPCTCERKIAGEAADKKERRWWRHPANTSYQWTGEFNRYCAISMQMNASNAN